MMQCVFTGPPRVGKSSFWNRVQGIIPERLLPSTDITGPEGSVRLDIRGSCGFAVQISEEGWRKIQAEEEMDGFLSLVTQQGAIPQLTVSHKHLAIEKPHPPLAQETVSGNKDAEMQTQEAQIKTLEDQNERKQRTTSPVEADPFETHKVSTDQDNGQDIHSEIDFAVPKDPQISQDVQVMDLQLPSPSAVLKQALINTRLAQVSMRIDSASFVLCTDTGGQPEYQELLSLLMAAANAVFIIFNLEHDLHSLQPLEYLPSLTEEPVKYESPHTVGEMLYQSLVSVPVYSWIDEIPHDDNKSSTKSIKGQSVNRSCAFFIGTHKDKVSTQRIEELNRKLIELIQDTPQYRANIVQQCTAGSIIFGVDNFSSLEKDEDFAVIRRSTQSLVYGSHLKVKAPTSWLFTGIVLQKLSETQPIISLDQYHQIAEQCGIQHDSFRSCLKFLHLKIGAIRYYETEHLCNTVFIKPQLVMNVLSHLMKRAFLNHDVNKAIIDDEDVISACKEFEFIKADFLLKLARDLLLICPHPHSTVQDPMYYLTCMLPTRKDIADTNNSTAVLLTLEGFILPIGIGRATITAIMQKQKDSDPPWRIHHNRLYRNCLEFTVSSPDTTFKIQSSVNHMCLTVNTIQPKKKMCSDVRIKIEQVITEVLKLYYYGCVTTPIVTFFCPLCAADGSRSHYAMLLSEDRIQCSQTKNESNIPPNLKHWVLVR